MTRYAILCGSAPEDFRQKKLNDLFDSLIEKDGWHVTCLANGTNELMLEYALNNILDGNAGDEASGVMLYFCTEKTLADSEETFWLCGNEIRKDVIDYYSQLAEKCKNHKMPSFSLRRRRKACIHRPFTDVRRQSYKKSSE